MSQQKDRRFRWSPGSSPQRNSCGAKEQTGILNMTVIDRREEVWATQEIWRSAMGIATIAATAVLKVEMSRHQRVVHLGTTCWSAIHSS